MSGSFPAGPDQETITEYITTTFRDVDVVSIDGMRFFSLDPEKHWPNFATLVWADDTEQVSDLSRPGVFRLSMGVNRPTLERIAAAEPDPDYTALDRVVPAPRLCQATVGADPQSQRVDLHRGRRAAAQRGVRTPCLAAEPPQATRLGVHPREEGGRTLGDAREQS